MTNEIGNLSTIVKFVSMTLAGYLIGALASKGLNLPIDADLLSQMIGALIFFGLAYIDATGCSHLLNSPPQPWLTHS